MSPRVFASRLERIRETLHPTDPTYCAELLEYEDAEWLVAVNAELLAALKRLRDLPVECSQQDDRAAWDQAHAAIAKAQGPS